ncbi:MAG: LON peptidase substrate-binding domain-containing protein [Acidobacteriota bacterium]|nr:LON peptidase substrate-binding domain-containing protein [Acidobacteriota bacterium]
MSDVLEKVSGIRHLPLFPLPLVLLPNEFLPLHIFEPRYQQMLKDVALEKNMFGISYFNPTEEFIEKPPTGSIGCVTEIREIQTMPDGRSNVSTVGVVRYQLIEYISDGAPYLVGDVEFFEDDEEDETVLNPLADEVFALFRRVARAAHKLSGERGIFPDVQATEPQSLSFLVTAAFNLEPDLKYQLLETRSTIERLKRLKEILIQTVDKMEESAEINKIAKTNGHSKKKLDI